MIGAGGVEMRKKSGFTLVELVVVIAILAILAAILIPLVSGYFADAQAAACAVNRRTLLEEILLKTAKDSTISLTELNRYLDERDATCPGGGTYSVTMAVPGDYRVVCSQHTEDAGGGGGGSSPNYTDVFDKGLQALVGSGNSNFLDKWNSDNTNCRIDSGGGNWAPTVSDAMGDLTDLDIKTWVILNNKSKNAGVEYVWSAYDVSSGEYAAVPAISYNVATGKYTATLSNVTQRTDGSKSFYTIAANAELSGFNSGGNKDMTYEEALEYYKSLEPKKK